MLITFTAVDEVFQITAGNQREYRRYCGKFLYIHLSQPILICNH